MRQHPPGAAAPGQVEDGVDDLPQGILPGSGRGSPGPGGTGSRCSPIGDRSGRSGSALVSACSWPEDSVCRMTGDGPFPRRPVRVRSGSGISRARNSTSISSSLFLRRMLESMQMVIEDTFSVTVPSITKVGPSRPLGTLDMKKNINVLHCIIVIFFISLTFGVLSHVFRGPVPASRIAMLRHGMTKAEVEQTLGPASSHRDDYLKYQKRFSFGYLIIYFDEDDKLKEFTYEKF
jgi:hypothetical protein